MHSTQDIISLLGGFLPYARDRYGITRLGVFGSVARGDDNENSDVDLFVDMEPKITTITRLKEFLEKLLNRSVDLVRKHKHLNPFLLKEIEKDGAIIF